MKVICEKSFSPSDKLINEYNSKFISPCKEYSDKKHRKLMSTIENSTRPASKNNSTYEDGLSIKKKSKIFEIKVHKKQISEFKKINDIFEDSYLNNLLLNESEFKKYEGKTEVENQYLYEDGSNLDYLYNLFKKSTLLKSTIVIDPNGNNNLTQEHKKLLDNYFYEKSKKIDDDMILSDFEENKANTIPVEKYKENYLLFKQNKLKGQKNKNRIKINKIKVNKILNKKKISKKNNIQKSSHLGEVGNEKKNESFFEVSTNKSFNSSFLGSSLNDTFYQQLFENKFYY